MTEPSPPPTGDPQRMPGPTPPPGTDQYADDPIVIHPAEFRAVVPPGQHNTYVPHPYPYGENPYAQSPYAQGPYAQNPYRQPTFPPGRYPHPAQYPQYGPPAPIQVTTTVHTPIVVRTSSCPHGLHLVLTVLTCGLWLPIWIIDAILRG